VLFTFPADGVTSSPVRVGFTAKLLLTKIKSENKTSIENEKKKAFCHINLSHLLIFLLGLIKY
jgi:hypothetical protein